MKRVTWLMLAFAVQAAAVAAGPLTVEVIDKSGKPTPNAVVLLQVAGAGGRTPPPLPREATVAQEKMQFVPAVSLVARGATVRFVNHDPWDHHVRSSAAGAAQFTAAGKDGFGLRLPGHEKGEPARAVEVTLDQPGVVGANLLGCHIHGSMRGFIYVSDTPWAAKTGSDGTVHFDDVPDGPVQVRVWQADQLIDLPPQLLQLTRAQARVSMQLQVVPRRARL
jgi:plastocyanin